MDVAVFVASKAHVIMGFASGVLMSDAVMENRPKDCILALVCFATAVCLAIT